MKKILAVLAASFVYSTAFASGNFTFVAPTAPVGPVSAPATLASLTSAITAVGTGFGYTASAAGSTFAAAADALTLSIKIKTIDMTNAGGVEYVNGELSVVTNLPDLVSSATNWVHDDTAGYDTAVAAFKDAAGAYLVTVINEGEYGIHKVLNAIDGGSRAVNGEPGAPVNNYNGIIAQFNGATVIVDKISFLDAAIGALADIQAQAGAINTALDTVLPNVNTVLLPAAGANAASYGNLDALLIYHGLLNPI